MVTRRMSAVRLATVRQHSNRDRPTSLGPVPLTPPSLRDPLWVRAGVRARGRWLAARHPALRRVRNVSLSAGTAVHISPAAAIAIAPGFVARRDLTLSVQGRLTIGRGMFCNRGVMLAAMREVTIGDDVRLGERVSVIDHNHVIEPLDDLPARFGAYEAAPIVIGDRVLVGANCVILAGARIGDDAVIGAGSVIRGEIPAGVLATGVPARVKRSLRATDGGSPT
jgi:acetyltransferase-like isoleucine patch superfamily enzyme